jgi:hypothetical protein
MVVTSFVSCPIMPADPDDTLLLHYDLVRAGAPAEDAPSVRSSPPELRLTRTPGPVRAAWTAVDHRPMIRVLTHFWLRTDL